MRIYRTVHYLSLDIVLGALAISAIAARLFQASPGWAWWVCLAMTVWLLYMGDHMVDAWKQRKVSKRELHQFLFRHRRSLLYFTGLILLTDLILVFNFLGSQVLKYALFLSGGVLLFYAMRHVFRKNRLLFLPGEFFVLLFYLAGTWLGPFVARTEPLQPSHGLVLAMTAGVLLMNLVTISLYDIQRDSRLGIASMAHTLGKRTTRNLMIFTAAGIYLLAVLQFMVYGIERYAQFAFILSGMATILLFILFYPSYFRKNDAFRMAADAVLFMGFLTLVVK